MKPLPLLIIVGPSLQEPGDAAFCAKKMTAETILDFDGVESASQRFLEVLLKGISESEASKRLIGMSLAVQQAVAAWFGRHTVQADGTTVLQVAFERPSGEGERYTPTRLVARLGDQLTSYIESAYPLNDPTLVRARRKLLREELAGHLLAQEPYIETTPRYQMSKLKYDGLGLKAGLASFLTQLAETNQEYRLANDVKTLLFPGMYLHQETAFTKFMVEKKDILVATGTGSGKTECFLVPMLGALHEEASSRPASFAKPGVRALILYPMNALVNDQLSRLRVLFGDNQLAAMFRKTSGGRHPRFGMYTGRTQYPGPRNATKDEDRVEPMLDYYAKLPPDLRAQLQRLGRYPAKNLAAFHAKHLAGTKKVRIKAGVDKWKTVADNHWDERLDTDPSDRELLIRQEMVSGAGSAPGGAPDILITNYSMLEFMLMRPFERPIFEETKAWLAGEGNQFLLVLDEAHMYRGAKGAEVAFLIRRLCARLGISGHPEKLRVICTSASLGSGEEALNNIRKFAADLTGKKPDDFVAITGQRESPKLFAPAGAVLGDILSMMDLQALHAAAKPEVLVAALAPLFAHLDAPNLATDEDGTLAHLHAVLRELPVLNLLLKETSKEARALSVLSAALFPGHAKSKKATEVLITLGTIARPEPDEPGLVPTRVHAMFRGLHGLFACINSRCPGRQDAPGEQAVLGSLFIHPRSSCPDCHSRVYEIASCRNCGSPYLITFVEGNVDHATFLWGETEGQLHKVQALPVKPRYSDTTREISVFLRTGMIDTGLVGGEDDARRLWLPVDDSGHGVEEFDRCPMCQPSAHARSRISDFRTRGEPPFTALIEAQFAEQPPQKRDPTLANQGRKVLVFSDGRQKAAKLAPALDHAHARDSFRQVLALAADVLDRERKDTCLNHLYPALLYVCCQRGVDLFPSQDEVEFHNDYRSSQGRSLADLIDDSAQNMLQPKQPYARALFLELTDRFYSLNALGLGSFEENPKYQVHLKQFPGGPLTPEQVRTAMRCWIRLQLESRCFLPPGADAFNLGEGWEHPEGLDLKKSGQIFPLRYQQFLARALGVETLPPTVETWFAGFVRTGQTFKSVNDKYFLDPRGLTVHVRVEEPWLHCQDCGRLFHEVLKDTCPACLGVVKVADPDYLDARNGLYRRSLRRAFDTTSLEPFGLTTEEHTAQLTGREDDEAFNKVEKHELRFQDIRVDGAPPVDVLSCTTTMEVGIDIGTLCGVALRNVPPHVANYQQRAGRAGRRGRSVASVVTYAHGSSHDAHYFTNPGLIISGDVRAPIVYIENQQVLTRHIRAFLLQRFFHNAVPHSGTSYGLFESFGKVSDFLSNEHACSLQRFTAWLTQHRDRLVDEVLTWAPSYSFGLGEPIPEVGDTVRGAVDNFGALLTSVLPIEEFARRTEIEGLDRENLERQLGENLLETLIARAILPRYAFPTDVVSFWVAKTKGKDDKPYKRIYDYEPQRDLQLALSEYAPGSDLTVNKFRFSTAAIYSPYSSPAAAIAGAQPYVSCTTCGFVSVENGALSLVECPCCFAETLKRERFIKPPGFAPDINAKRQVDRGEPSTSAGRATRAQLEVQQTPNTWNAIECDGRLRLATRSEFLVTVNKGVGDRGFIICPDCGRAEAIFGPGYPRSVMMKGGKVQHHVHPVDAGVQCTGTPSPPLLLGHRFPTDILLMELAMAAPVVCPTADTAASAGRPGRTAVTSLVEALCLAASRTLQIDEGELGGNWCPIWGGGADRVQLFLYDLLPGGAGYTRMVRENLNDVLNAADALLAGCECESSCYDCLRHYGNKFIHASLDRHLALDLLRHVRTGLRPAVADAAVHAALVPLIEVVRLRGATPDSGVVREGVTVPLVIRRASGSEVWVDVHHPFLDASHAQSAVRDAADAGMFESCLVDLHTLQHNLPAVVAKLAL